MSFSERKNLNYMGLSMARSMTGFGRSLVEDAAFVQQWEVRSVNGKHLDIRWHLPSAVRSLQVKLDKCARKSVMRGRVDISLVLQYRADVERMVYFDSAQANAMLKALQTLARSRKEAFVPDYSRFLNMPALWDGAEEERVEHMTERLEEGLCLALDDWNESRSSEGAALVLDMHSRLLRMESWVDIIEERVPSLKEEKVQTVRERISEVLGGYDVDFDEGRFLQEVVMLGDKLDVSEEITRLRSHLYRLNELLQMSKDVGRKLDFTLQECFREINTCGNKIPDVQLSPLVVDLKNELEKCREQAQNIE